MAEKTPEFSNYRPGHESTSQHSHSGGATFEDKVNEIIDKRLRDQTRLPAEFRSWLPKFIEIQDIRLPMSQVQGLYLTGGTVADLGGGVHGRIGMIRAGDTPYDFIQVTYDAFYDKWVSDPTLVTTQINTQVSTTSTSYVSNANASPGLLNWQTMTDAGLVPQFRFFANIAVGGGATGTATIQYLPFAADGTFGTPVDSTEFAVTTTSATNSIRFTDWLPVPAGVTANDYLATVVRFKTSNVAQACVVAGANLWNRWVS